MKRRDDRERPTVLLMVRRGALVPYAKPDARALEDYRENDLIRCELERADSESDWKLRRRWWAIVTFSAKALDCPQQMFTKDILALRLKIRCGLIARAEELWEGRMVAIPQSLSSLDAAQFRDFYERSMHVLFTDFLPGSNEEQILELAGAGRVR